MASSFQTRLHTFPQLLLSQQELSMKSSETCAFVLSQSKTIINDAMKRSDIRPFRPPCYLVLKPVRSRTVSHEGPT